MVECALPKNFFAQDIVALAKGLLGCELLLDGVGGVIVETEAYEPADPASHSFRGQTARNAAMFGPGGRAYIYRIYGAHWCLNVVGGPQPGAAVLIRALEPTAGVETMRERRKQGDIRRLCAGPGKLCQALNVTNAQNGLSLTQPPFSLVSGKPTRAIAVGPRIGLTKAAETPWRFGVSGSSFLSRSFPLATDGSA